VPPLLLFDSSVRVEPVETLRILFLRD
jgi:hypothetical protein